MNERRYDGEIERLRSPGRLALLEVERVVSLSLEGLDAPKSMLDIGTGSAIFAEAFAAHGLSVAGIDLRDDMLAAARRYVPSGDFRKAHMEQLPFADDSFDLAFMGLVLHEADDLLTALQVARRVAKARVSVLEWRYEVQDFGPPMAHRLQPEIVRAAAEQAGFPTFDEQRLQSLVLYRLGING